MMKKVLRRLSMDIGGSEARSWCSLDGDVVEACDNDFYTIPEKNFRYKAVEDPLGVCRIVKAPKADYLGYVGVGLAAKQYTGDSLTLGSNVNKTSNLHYYLQLIYKIARDAMSAAVETDEEGSLVINTDNEFDYVIGVVIPIEEYSDEIAGDVALKANIVGEYEAVFPLYSPDAKVSFVIKEENIGVLPEGGVCVSALRKELTRETLSLVVDMGHVSTEIALFLGTSLYGKPATSVFSAGDTLIATVSRALKGKGYNLTVSQMKSVMETGMVRQGATLVDVKDIIAEAKVHFVRNYLKEDVLKVCKENRVTADQIEVIIPIGGPMNTSNGTGSIIHNLVKEIGAEQATIQILADDLRHANIRQLDKFTMIKYNQAIKRGA